jgi:serine/threonine protein phosphatase PrpC
MANRKLKNFEFANHTEKGKLLNNNTDKVEFFDSPNGSVFLLCQDSMEMEQADTPASIAAQRIKYYLENEMVADAANALYNALIYTNGFIYEHGRKNGGLNGAGVHCACVLIRDGKVWYSTVGEMTIFFYNGKRLHTLSYGASNETKANPGESQEVTGSLLGMNRGFLPVINTEPLIPLNNDMVLLSSRGFCNNVPEKSIFKILSDPMPVQTKVYRLVDMASIAGGEQTISIQLISFYNLDHRERVFKPLEARRTIPPRKIAVALPANEKEVIEVTDNEKPAEGFFTTPVKAILLILGVLLLGYMVYDLFIYNPVPVVNRQAAVESPTSQATVAAPAVIDSRIPDDVVYEVKTGDTWSRIYSQYEVCSWFIRNHEANAGKFDAAENPVSGTRISIPVVYSAKKELNPHFFQEFSLQNTGSRCENASQAYIDSFRSTHF